MTILLTGGGSGGHITPLLAVAAQLKTLRSDTELVYVGQTGDGLGDVPKASPYIDRTYTVRAGKYRRYNGESTLTRLKDYRTNTLNLRDAVYTLIGLGQSYRLLKRVKPDVIFIKGGFVGVPVGLAAVLLKIPFITHDSDAIPGLANRIVGRWAETHAVALPKELYKMYPPERTVTTGVPVQAEFKPVNPAVRRELRLGLGLPSAGQVVCVTGGGLGAARLNDAVLTIADRLLAERKQLHVFHVVGRAHLTSVTSAYDDLLPPAERRRVHVLGYVPDLYRYSAVADVVVTRAGATALAEFAVQARACVIVPNPQLTGGHQLKNAAFLERKHAALMVDEAKMHAQPEVLLAAMSELLDDPALAARTGEALRGFARPDSAEVLAKLLLDAQPA